MIRVVILGRPNVGKSSLFNRLYGRKRALVLDTPGVTRDRLELQTSWHVLNKEVEVTLVDTGGFGGDKFKQEVDLQVEEALRSADIALFVVDSQSGIHPKDEEVFKTFKKAGLFSKIPVLLVANKVDAYSHDGRGAEFYKFDLDDVVEVSAEHNRGIDDLKEKIVLAIKASNKKGLSKSNSTSKSAKRSYLEVGMDEDATDEDVSDEDVSEERTDDHSTDEDFTDDEDSIQFSEDNDSEDESGEHVQRSERRHDKRAHKVPHIAVVGRPNVGKSTLINALLGSNRMIVSPIAGTTVDSIDTMVNLAGKDYVIVDTAGVRRKNKTEQGVEVLSVVQTKKALERADLALFVCSSPEGISDQDEKIAGLIQDSGCSVVIIMNKWDAMKKAAEDPKLREALPKTQDEARVVLFQKLAFFKYAPLIFASAIRNRGLDDLGDLIKDVLEQREFKIPTSEFTNWIRSQVNRNNPFDAKFYFCHQSGRNPPTFTFHVNDPARVHFSLRRHIANGIRQNWGYMGTPLRLRITKAKNSPRKHKSTDKSNKSAR